MNTLIVSDLHLGARNSRTDLIAELLETDFDRLVLNGDTVDSPDLRRFRPCDWRVIDALRAAAHARELVVVRGNHDVPAHADRARSAGLLSGLLGHRCTTSTPWTWAATATWWSTATAST